jgi:DNA-binding beta-propeller fold protein YncE
VPGCSTAVASAPSLASVKTALTSVSGAPFGVAATPNGLYDFVTTGSVVSVRMNTGSAEPAQVGQVRLPGPGIGESMTRDGRYLLVADGGNGAYVVNVRAAEAGKANAVAGVLAAAGGSRFGGAIEVTASADGRFAFVSLEVSDRIAVFNLGRALTAGFGPADFVGTFPTGLAPVGMAVSPDGRWLYVTSEIAAHGAGPLLKRPGTLSVISVNKAETDPAHAVVTTVRAGCQPVRVITSADGSVVWVTARASDALLAFSAAKLVSDPAHAFISGVRVGEAPVGLALVKNGSRIVVADSNRFNAPGATASLAVVNVAAALAGRPALFGYVHAGLFPREMAAVPGGRILLVTNFGSGQLETVSLATLP